MSFSVNAAVSVYICGHLNPAAQINIFKTFYKWITPFRPPFLACQNTGTTVNQIKKYLPLDSWEWILTSTLTILWRSFARLAIKLLAEKHNIKPRKQMSSIHGAGHHLHAICLPSCF